MYKVLFVILDGVADHVIKDLGGKTPLEAAKKKNIDKLCKFAECGMHYTIDIGIIPSSDTGHLALFGYDPYKYYPGRGIFEALGIMNLDLNDIAFRINFGTVDENGILIDRRAQRNDYGIDELLKDFQNIIERIESEYDVKIILKHTYEHRGVLIIKGDLSEKVTDNDLHETGIKPPEIKPLEENAKITAEILNKLIKEFYEFAKNHPINKERKEKGILPVNYLLIRGASKYKPLKEEDLFYNRYNLRGVFIAGAPMYLGVAKYVGLDTYKPLGANGTVRTSLFSKAEAAIKYRDKYDIVFVHVKATDTLSHDKKPKEKKKFIEKIDQEFFSRVKDEFDIIVLTGDHTTSSILGKHTADPVPIMIYSTIDVPQRKDPVKNFAERKCFRGILGFIKGKDIMKIILNKLGKASMFGT